MDSVVRVFSFMVILAKPTEPGDLDDSSSEAVSSSDAGSDSNVSSPTAKSQVEHEKNIPQQNSLHTPHSNIHLSTHSTDRSVFSVDGYASSSNHSIPHIPGSMPQSSIFTSLPSDPNTLSSKNVSTDAFSFRPPRGKHERIPKSKTMDDKKKMGITTPIKGLSSKVNQADKHDDIEDFIREFIQRTSTSNVKDIKFFDAAVVYDKTDFEAVQQFISEVKSIIRIRLQEDVRIELFDSLEFAQSKVMVVEDVVERCSVVFVYLTEHCNEEAFRLFCDEGIGITRLGISGSRGLWDHERQWVLKPVHTQPMQRRRYKIPVGLVSLQSIDWYDKDSTHTKERLVQLLEYAIRQRKRRESQTNAKLDNNRHREEINGFSNANSSLEKPARSFEKNNPQVSRQSLSEDALSFPSQENGTLNQMRGGNGPKDMLYNSYAPSTSRIMSTNYAVHNSYPSVPQSPYYVSLPQQYHPGNNNQYGQHVNFMQTVPSQTDVHIQHPAYSSQQQYPHLSNPYGPLQINPMYQAPNQTHLQTQVYGYSNTQQYTYNQQPPHNLQHDLRHQLHPHMATDPSHPSNSLQQIPTGQNVIIQSASLCPPECSQDVPRSLSVTPQAMQNQHVQNNSNYNPTPLSQRQPSPRLEQRNMVSDNGNYMRDTRNDAPSHTNLSVVSRVTGKLITNPNLSTDDIEVDEPSGRGEPSYLPKAPKHHRIPVTGHSNGNHLLSGRSLSSGRMDSSSSEDSDIDLPIPRGKSKTSKGKMLNLYGCKNIQLGSGNQVVEKKITKRRKRSARKHSATADTRQFDEPSINNLKLPEYKDTDMSVDRGERSSVSSSTAMAEDFLDTSFSTEGMTHILPGKSTTDDAVTQNADYIGEITCDIYQRRVQKRLQSQPTANTTGPVEINGLDKPQLHDVTTGRKKQEYNLLDKEYSDPENKSDSELHEGVKIAKVVRPEMNRQSEDSAESREKEEEEVKAFNIEARFAFSYFKENQQKMLMNPLRPLKNSFSNDNSCDDLD